MKQTSEKVVLLLLLLLLYYDAYFAPETIACNLLNILWRAEERERRESKRKQWTTLYILFYMFDNYIRLYI
jgi:hypothetical protein